jgi:hypothetical protein
MQLQRLIFLTTNLANGSNSATDIDMKLCSFFGVFFYHIAQQWIIKTEKRKSTSWTFISRSTTMNNQGKVQKHWVTSKTKYDAPGQTNGDTL